MNETTPASRIHQDLRDGFQVLDTRFLLAIAQGEVDAARLARTLLAERGVDNAGKWVGFAKAQQAHSV